MIRECLFPIHPPHKRSMILAKQGFGKQAIFSPLHSREDGVRLFSSCALKMLRVH